MKHIQWITFNAFIDTDIYIVKELAKFYSINWHVIRSGNDKFEYASMLDEMKQKENLTINLHVCGRRLRKIESAVFFTRLLRKLKMSDADLFYTSMAGAPYFIPLLAILLKRKTVIVAIHNVHVPKGGSAYYFFKLYNKMTIGCFNNFQTFSRSQYDDLKTIAPQKNVYYAPFILKDYGKSEKSRTSELITFLNFGNIREYKRIDILIEAAQQAYEVTRKKFRVIIAGKCDEWQKYQKLIKYDFLFDLRIGRVENEDIPDLFNETDYFVAPYQDIAQSGSAMVAMNYSKPIIASKLPAFKEVVRSGETGYLITPACEDELVEVMIDILRNENQTYERLINNIEKVKQQKFATEAIVEKYKEIFEDVIAK